MKLRTAIASSALAITAPAVHAGGFYVGENGAQSMSRAGAYAASVDDATAIYHNPAGLALADHTQLYVGFNLLDMTATYQREGDYNGTQDPYPKVSHQGPPLPIPFLALNVPAGRLSFGAGLFFPAGFAGGNFGERVKTASGVDRAAPQRYDIVSTDGALVMPSAAVALRVTDGLRIGARFSAVWIKTAAVAYGQALPNEEESEMLDAKSTIDATDSFTPQLGLGAHVRHGGFELGVAYTSQLHFDLRGTTKIDFAPGVTLQVDPVPDAQARCAPGGRVGALKTCVSTTQFPQTAVGAARWVARDSAGRVRGDLELDVRWEDWSASSGEHVIIDGAQLGVRVPDKAIASGFRDSWSFRLGGSRALSRDGSYVVRAGVAYDTAPAPISWTRLTVNGMAAFTFGGGFGLAFDRWRLDAGFAYVFSPPRIVHDYPMGPDGKPQQPNIESFDDVRNPFNAGRYERSFAIGTIGATVLFGGKRRAAARPKLEPDPVEVVEEPAAPPAAPAAPVPAPAITPDDVRAIVREELAQQAVVQPVSALQATAAVEPADEPAPAKKTKARRGKRGRRHHHNATP